MYENRRRSSMTSIGSQLTRRRYTGWPSVVFGNGALMQAVQTNTSWRLGNVKPRIGQLLSPNSSSPDLMCCWMPKHTQLNYVCPDQALHVRGRYQMTCRRRRLLAWQAYLRDSFPKPPSTSHRRRVDSLHPSRHPSHRLTGMLPTYYQLRSEHRPNLPARCF